MNKTTIYHNPRCSKSRQALAILQEHDLDIEIIDYLKTPFNKSSLQKLLKLLNMSPREILRTKEKDYRELGLADSSLSDAQIVRNIIEYPKLLERPIVLHGNKAIVARPPERLLDILS